jgi:hypothetical protein
MNNLTLLSKTKFIALVVVFAIVNLTFGSLGFAQSNAPPSAGNEIVVPDGTQFNVETIDEISSKSAVEGDPVSFRVKEDVVINGKVVIAKGSIAKGVISSAQKNGRMGKAGKLSIRVETVAAVDGQKVHLRATKGREGNDKTGTTVALVVLFGPLGFLKKGKDAKIKPGTEINVFTDEQIKIVTQ